MEAPRTSLVGRSGWTVVGSLGALLAALVFGQLPLATAGAETPRPVVAAPASLPDDLAVGEMSGTRPVGWPAVRRAPAPPVQLPAPPVAAPVAAPPAPLRPAVPAPAAPAPAPAAPAPAPPAAAPAAVTPPAPVAPSLCSGAGWEQRRGEAALTSLRAGAARTGFSVGFSAARSGYLGMTLLEENRIEMYVRSCDKQSTELLRHVMAHELGHAWDTTQMSDVARTAYQVARGIPVTTPWYGCSGCTDFATPAGDFAEAYAQWARGATTNNSKLAGDVGGAQLSALARQFFGA